MRVCAVRVPGSGLDESYRRRPGPGPPRQQRPVGHDRVPGRRGHRDPVRRLVRRPVVAREPGRRPDRLAGHEGAVGQLLPAQVAPVAGYGSRHAAVAERDLERPPPRDPQLPVRVCIPHGSPVEPHPIGAQRAEVQADLGERPRGDRRHGGPAGQPPTLPVLQREVVVADPVPLVAVPGEVLRYHAAIGLPSQRPAPGTCSPRITSEAGPTVACAPTVTPGSTMPCGPRVAPVSRVTVSMRMIRSWNRCVCTTHPRLTVAASPTRMRSASGSQYVSHHTPRPTLAPRLRSQTPIHGVPPMEPASHGTASISTNVSASSLRHTKPLHSGRSPGPNRPTRIHLA